MDNESIVIAAGDPSVASFAFREIVAIFKGFVITFVGLVPIESVTDILHVVPVQASVTGDSKI